LRPDRLLIVSDTHSPYEDKRAWGLMMKVARKFKPDTIVHIGDLADCYIISAHSKSPTRANQLDAELEGARRLRAQLDRLGASRKIFVEGNHEDRIRRYLQDKAPALFSLVDTDKLLGLTENNWEFCPYKESARVGKVYFTHDTGQSGKYTVARALDTFQSSVVIGHHHQMQYRVEGDATGKHRVGAQFGWLGSVKDVDYLHRVKARRNWSLGFGLGYHDRASGYVHLVPVPLVGYTACVEGRIYRA
jgi:predicted phosphodiesterase